MVAWLLPSGGRGRWMLSARWVGAQVTAVWSPVLFTSGQYVYMFYSESTKCKKNPTSRKPARWSPGGDIRMVKSRDGLTWTTPVTIYTQVRSLPLPACSQS
jgi:hypothetical protein